MLAKRQAFRAEASCAFGAGLRGSQLPQLHGLQGLSH